MSQPAAAIEPAPASPETPEPAERVYFPELDGMRFIAFLLVYLFHRGVPWALLTRASRRWPTRSTSVSQAPAFPGARSRRVRSAPSPDACRKTADTASSSSSS